MKSRFQLGQMIQYLPGQLKDAIHHASQEAGQDTDKLELHRRGHSEKAQTNQIDPTFRKSLKYVSARTQDRDDEIVVPNGIELADFMKYGAVLVNHNYSLMPIGSDEKIWADDFGIKALTVHADTGEGTLANVVWHLVSQGHMKASSIGFVPVETTKPGRRDWDAVANKLQREWPEFSKAAAEKSVSRIITKGVLLEHSFVSVPCNVDAEVEQIIKGMGIRDETVFKGLGWKAEEKDGILVPKREVIVIETPDGKVSEKGGSGSGNFGHAGRPGQVGGSDDDGGGADREVGSSGKEEIVRGPNSIYNPNGKLAAEVVGARLLDSRKVGTSIFHTLLHKNPHTAASEWHDVIADEDSHIMRSITMPRPKGKSSWRVSATNSETENNEHFTFLKDLFEEDGKIFNGEVEEKGEGPDEKSLDLTCSRKLASLRKRMGEDSAAKLDALEKEMEGLAEDDAEGWKTLNGKLNALLAGLKKENDGGEGKVVEEKGEGPDDEEGRWVTMRGRRVFIREGQDPKDALAENLAGKKKPKELIGHPDLVKDSAGAKRLVDPENNKLGPNGGFSAELGKDGAVYVTILKKDPKQGWIADNYAQAPKEDGLTRSESFYIGKKTIPYQEVAEVANDIAGSSFPDRRLKIEDDEEDDKGFDSERIIKVVQPPPTIKVLFAPLDPQELAEVAGAAAEKAISRRLGRLG